ncbi:MAG: response regulator transcription factor [Crocinitomicaceae bacterium]|nr:response regulator transcription factor [Crocinitomicaceae bacterium]
MSKKILVIDDEEEIRELLLYNLKKENFEVFEGSSGAEALSFLSKNHVDLILLDIMMPDMDGIEVCEKIRLLPNHENTIICFLTARNEDYSQIAGFDAGADDYIAKPIRPRVLISRIQAILRRTESIAAETTEQTFDDIKIDREKYIVSVKGEAIHLPRKEFELLALLATKPDHVFERNHILEHVWGNEIVVGDRTIDVHIRKLREKIGSTYIKTIKGVGYKFVQNN